MPSLVPAQQIDKAAQSAYYVDGIKGVFTSSGGGEDRLTGRNRARAANRSVTTLWQVPENEKQEESYE